MLSKKGFIQRKLDLHNQIDRKFEANDRYVVEAEFHIRSEWISMPLIWEILRLVCLAELRYQILAARTWLSFVECMWRAHCLHPSVHACSKTMPGSFLAREQQLFNYGGFAELAIWEATHRQWTLRHDLVYRCWSHKEKVKQAKGWGRQLIWQEKSEGLGPEHGKSWLWNEPGHPHKDFNERSLCGRSRE